MNANLDRKTWSFWQKCGVEMIRMKRETPWDYLQQRDIDHLGDVIADPVEQQRWSRAMFLGGQLPWAWAQADVVRRLMYEAMELRQGDRVLCVGEGLDTSGFREEIERRIGPDGHLEAYEIMDTAREHLAAGGNGQWPYRYTEQYEDNSFDLVTFPQGIHHAVEWNTVARDVVRVLKPGRPVVLSEARFGPLYEEAIKSHILIEAIFLKIRQRLGYFEDELIDYSPEQLNEAFGDLLENIKIFEWKGFLLYHGRKPVDG